jgi:small-conductance mechanosensitive channel
VLHLILQSTALILVILIAIMLGTGLVRRLMSRRSFDRRQSHALRLILESSIRVLGVVLILFVIFGVPQQTSTVLGLSTAALTIALQDFILAFFGWFRLVGKRGIAVGDWVEINGVSGEVIEVGMMTTTLLETGSFAARGYPTGRRITFINNFAIRGQYFNFSTTGQWMWDEITVGVPASADTSTVVDRVLHTVQEETQENTRVAEQEWKRVTHGEDLGKFRMDPAVNLRPSASGVELEVRYVTRASERFEMRDRLQRRVLELLQQSPQPAQPVSAR